MTDRSVARPWVAPLVVVATIAVAGFGAREFLVALNDRALHAGAWLVLGAAMRWALARSAPYAGATALSVSALSFAVALGAADELVQTWVVLRSAEWGDLLADAAGGTLGVVLHHLVTRRDARAA